MDFGVLPPEVNSGRMYAGPGPGPMLAAAAAWDDLSVQLYCAAAAYRSEISGLVDASWLGPSASAMAVAITPYLGWISATAAQAEQAAIQAKAAAAAYETAFAATVPPPVIMANRSLLMMLIATNLLGQNTPQIAVAEAHYAQMWAQDAAAMYDYAGSSALAAQITPFTPPPQTANSSGAAGQAAAVAQAAGTGIGADIQAMLSQLVSVVPEALQGLALPSAASSTSSASGLTSSMSSLATLATNLTGPYSPFAFTNVAVAPYLFGIQNVLLPQNGQGVATVLSSGQVKSWLPASFLPSSNSPPATLRSACAGTDLASARMANGGLIGGLSVPQTWAAAAPAITPVAKVFSGPGLAGAGGAVDSPSGLASNMALSGLAGRTFGDGIIRSIGTTAGHAVTSHAAATPTAATDVDTAVTIIVLPPTQK